MKPGEGIWMATMDAITNWRWGRWWGLVVKQIWGSTTRAWVCMCSNSAIHVVSCVIVRLAVWNYCNRENWWAWLLWPNWCERQGAPESGSNRHLTALVIRRKFAQINWLITLRGLGLGQPHCRFCTVTFCSRVCEGVSLAYLISHNQHIYNLENWKSDFQYTCLLA